jgi:hypothetical protein
MIGPTKEGLLSLRCGDEEKGRWEEQARAEGYSTVSVWARERLNEACGDPKQMSMFGTYDADRSNASG